jgi:membrane associated rhomboid family serine protease
LTGDQPPPVPKKRFPTPVQAVVLTLAGFAMTFFGCLGAIASWDTSEVLVGIALVAAIVGVIALGVGLISVLYLFVKGVVRAFQDSRQKTSPPSDGSPPADSVTPPPTS